MHADYHWDSADDFREDEEAQAKLAVADLDGLRSMTASDKRITSDCFIAPAVHRKLFSEFTSTACRDHSEPLDEVLYAEFETPQHLHADTVSLGEQPSVLPRSDIRPID